jgi:hypothetical protein
VINQTSDTKGKLYLKWVLICVEVFLLFFIKIQINNLLIAENGDTYEFFQMAQDIRSGNLPEGKRMILFPLILSLADKGSFVPWGRIITTSFYLSSIFLVYLIVHKLTKNKIISLCAAAVYTLNTIILDNSFYIMSDTLSTSLVLLFFYLTLTDKKNYTLLAFIAGLAFITRVENIVLFAALGLNLILLKDRKSVVKPALVAGAFILFVLAKNFLKFGNPVFTAYAQDQAGFNLNIKNIYLALANLIFVVGGIWFLPIALESVKSIKFIKCFFIDTGKNIPVVTTALLTLILIAWSPVVRLYSILASMLIVWLFYFFNKIYEQNIRFRKSHLVLFILSMILFLIATQIFNQKDYGMFKISKATNIVLSFIIFYLLFLSGKQIKRVVIPVSILVCVINLLIFTERFNVTRYKYATIKEAVSYYSTYLVKEGNLGYMDESGLEAWFLNDKYGKLNYLNTKEPLTKWVENNDVRFVLYTSELGYVPDSVMPYKEFISTQRIIKEFKSPFPGGYTKIVDLRFNR